MLIISESFRVKRLLLIIISCPVEVGQLMGCLYCFKNIRTVRINSRTILFFVLRGMVPHWPVNCGLESLWFHSG